MAYQTKEKIKCNELQTEYVKKLESLNIDLLNFLSRSLHIDKAWEERFELLNRFVNKNGHLPQESEVYGGVDLYKWLIKEKYRLKKYKLDDAHLAKLKSINIDLSDFPSQRRSLW